MNGVIDGRLDFSGFFHPKTPISPERFVEITSKQSYHVELRLLGQFLRCWMHWKNIGALVQNRMGGNEISKNRLRQETLAQEVFVCCLKKSFPQKSLLIFSPINKKSEEFPVYLPKIGFLRFCWCLPEGVSDKYSEQRWMPWPRNSDLDFMVSCGFQKWWAQKKHALGWRRGFLFLDLSPKFGDIPQIAGAMLIPYQNSHQNWLAKRPRDKPPPHGFANFDCEFQAHMTRVGRQGGLHPPILWDLYNGVIHLKSWLLIVEKI